MSTFSLPTVRMLGIAVAAAATMTATQAGAQGVDFARKTVTIYIGNTPGGSYDLYGRVFARYLGKHLPGQPTVIATNMPGAGTLKAANYIYSVAPKDGTAIGIVSELLAVEQLLGNSAVQYDARKYPWVGRLASSNNIHMQWHTSKVQSIQDALKIENPVAGTGAGNIAERVPKLLNAVIGTKFKVISGYPASNEAMAAMEKGEVDGSVSSWAAVKIGKKQWLDEKKIKVILQDVPERAADLPDVPTLVELGRNAEEKQILGLYASGGLIGRAFMLPPDTPAAVVKAVRDGFEAMTKDAEMIAEMKKINLDLEPLGHEPLEKAVAAVLATPPDVVAKVKAIVGDN